MLFQIYFLVRLGGAAFVTSCICTGKSAEYWAQIEYDRRKLFLTFLGTSCKNYQSTPCPSYVRSKHKLLKNLKNGIFLELAKRGSKFFILPGLQVFQSTNFLQEKDPKNANPSHAKRNFVIRMTPPNSGAVADVNLVGSRIGLPLEKA